MTTASVGTSTFHHRNRQLRPRELAAALALIVSIASLALLSGRAANQTTPAHEGTPCPAASPLSSTPAASPAADLSAPATPCVPTVPALGTPITISGLTITVVASNDQAGPNDLTIEVREPGGAPVTGATVTVIARSLEMDMGASPHAATETESGRYVAERVPMGMGGEWQVEVAVEVPGQPAVVVFFLVTLGGPM